MSYYLNDVPADPVRIESFAEDFDLSRFDAATATIRKPNGVVVSAVPAVIAGDAIEVEIPDILDDAGIYRLRVTVTGGDKVQRVPQVRFVVQDEEDGWHTLDSIRDEWEDAEHIPDPTLYELLDIVRGQVIEFAPALGVDDEIPAHYRYGQKVHARNTWNATRVAADGTAGEGDFVLRPFPLDWHVKQILRPQSGKPVVA